MWPESVWVAPEQAARAQELLAQPQAGAAADAVRQLPPQVQLKMREGGMLDVEGDTQAVRQWLEDAGIPTGALMDGPGMVVVTAGSVERAKQALAGAAPASSEQLSIAQPASSEGKAAPLHLRERLGDGGPAQANPPASMGATVNAPVEAPATAGDPINGQVRAARQPPPAQMSMLADGRLEVKGDTKALRAWLAESGIHPRFVRKTNDGVVITQHSAENARWALTRSQSLAEPKDGALAGVSDFAMAQGVVLGADPGDVTAPHSENTALSSDLASHTRGKVSFQKGAMAVPKELRAAQMLADRGYDVQFVVTANNQGKKGEPTGDVLMSGVGRVEFYKPETEDLENIIRMIIRKRKQAPALLVQTDLSEAVVQSVAVRLWGNPVANEIRKLFIQRSSGDIIEIDRNRERY